METERSRRETERVLWWALAYVPSDKAEEILRSAPTLAFAPLNGPIATARGLISP